MRRLLVALGLVGLAVALVRADPAGIWPGKGPTGAFTIDGSVDGPTVAHPIQVGAGSTTTTTGGPTTTTTTTTTSTTTTTLTTPPDLSAQFATWWDCEQASNSTRTNHSGATAGTDGDLDRANDVTKNTTQYQEATASCDGGTYLGCTASVCNEIEGTAGSSLAWGGWTWDVADASSAYTWNKYTTNAGYFSIRFGAANTLRCGVGNGSSTVNQDTVSNGFPTGQWVWTVCTFNNTTNEIVPYIAGQPNGCTPGSTCASISEISPATATDAQFNFSDGRADEWFVWVGATMPTAAKWCHICSCGIDGTNGPCTCNGATYVGTGRRVSGCASCTLPASCSNPWG